MSDNLYQRIKEEIEKVNTSERDLTPQFLAGYAAAKKDVVPRIGVVLIEENQKFFRSLSSNHVFEPQSIDKHLCRVCGHAHGS